MAVSNIRNSVVYMLPVIVGNIIPIVTLPLFTRKLSTHEYGLYALAFASGTFLNGIAGFGLTTGYERYYFEYKEHRDKVTLLYTALSFVLTATLVFSIGTFFLGDFIAEYFFKVKDEGQVFFWTYLAISFTSFKLFYLSYYRNSENAKAYSWFSIDEVILSTIFSVVLIVFFDLKIFGLVFGQLLASLVVFVILTWKFIRQYSYRYNHAMLQQLLVFSFPLTPKIFLGVIGSQIDKYLIGLISSVGGVGVYNVAQKIANVTFTFMTAIQNVFSPQVYRYMFDKRENEAGKLIGSYLTPFLYISTFVAFLISLFSEEIVYFVLPPAYFDSINIISIFSMLFLSYFFSKQPQLIFARKTAISSLLFILSIVLNISINYYFIKQWGTIGAAWGAFAATLIWGVIYFFVSQKYYFICWEWKKIGPVLLIFTVGSVAMILMRDAGVNFLVRLSCKLLLLAGFLLIGNRIGIVTKGNLMYLKMYISSFVRHGKKDY